MNPMTKRPITPAAQPVEEFPPVEEDSLQKEIEVFARWMRISADALPDPGPQTLRAIREQAFRRAGRNAAARGRFRILGSAAAALLLAGMSVYFLRPGLSGQRASPLSTAHCILTLMSYEEAAETDELALPPEPRTGLEALADRLIEFQNLRPEPTDALTLLQQAAPAPTPTTLQWHNIRAVPARIYG